jgi:glycosyltransferase involved in cell wall biosynthesis
MPKISVICPVYNTENLLIRCLDSVLNQTFADFEFILINDCSTDRSGEICRRYQKKETRIKYIVHEYNQGIFGARNTGLKHSTGQYITWIDSDDWVDSDWIDTLYNCIISHSADISIINSRNVYEKVRYREVKLNNEIFVFDNMEALHNLVAGRYITNALTDKLIKKELYRDLSFPEGRNCEDAAVMHILLSRANTIVYSTQNKYYYYYRLGSNMHRHSVKLEYDRFFMFKERLDYFENSGYTSLYKQQTRIVFDQGLYVLLMSLFYEPSSVEIEYFSIVKQWMNNAVNNFEIDEKKMKIFLYINGNHIQQIYVFFRYEYPKRLSYFIKQYFPPLVIIYRKLKYSFCIPNILI